MIKLHVRIEAARLLNECKMTARAAGQRLGISQEAARVFAAAARKGESLEAKRQRNRYEPVAEHTARAIVRDYRAGDVSMRLLADRYGLGAATIRRVIQAPTKRQRARHKGPRARPCKLCPSCMGSSWRRPRLKACACGERYAPEPEPERHHALRSNAYGLGG